MAFKVCGPTPARRPPTPGDLVTATLVVEGRRRASAHARADRVLRPCPKPTRRRAVVDLLDAWRAPCRTPHSSDEAGTTRRADGLARAGAGRHVHIHTLSAAGLLPAHGSPVQGRPERDPGRRGAARPGAACCRSASIPRTTRRRSSGARGERSAPIRRSGSFVTGHREDRDVRVAVRRLDVCGTRRRAARDHAQPADRDHRRDGTARHDPRRQRVEPPMLTRWTRDELRLEGARRRGPPR